MTTPDIPEVAVSAAHAAADACSFSHRPDGPWACCTTAGLAAALPHLGLKPEFGLLRRGDATPHPYPTLDHAEHARQQEPGCGPDGLAELHVRYVTAWERASSERRPR